jgi:hypothetical protein
MRLSEGFLEGPENSTLGVLGKPDGRMRLGPCRGAFLLGRVDRRR